MRALIRAGIGMMVLAVAIAASESHAAGALAIGKCAAYGYAYDYPTAKAAEAEALKKCAGSCKQVVATNRGCIAFAVDGHKPCGPHGYANAPRLGAAQNTALRQCHRYGGKDCMIRAWICDGRG